MDILLQLFRSPIWLAAPPLIILAELSFRLITDEFFGRKF
jgi:hypothetical protein